MSMSDAVESSLVCASVRLQLQTPVVLIFDWLLKKQVAKVALACSNRCSRSRRRAVAYDNTSPLWKYFGSAYKRGTLHCRSRLIVPSFDTTNIDSFKQFTANNPLNCSTETDQQQQQQQPTSTISTESGAESSAFTVVGPSFIIQPSPSTLQAKSSSNDFDLPGGAANFVDSAAPQQTRFQLSASPCARLTDSAASLYFSVSSQSSAEECASYTSASRWSSDSFTSSNNSAHSNKVNAVETLARPTLASSPNSAIKGAAAMMYGTISAEMGSTSDIASGKSLLCGVSTSSALSPYCASAMYNGQSPLSNYSISTTNHGAFYGNQSNQSSYPTVFAQACGRSIKSNPYPLNAYLSAATAGISPANAYYGTAYAAPSFTTGGIVNPQNFAGANQALEYGGYSTVGGYPQTYPQYYTNLGPYPAYNGPLACVGSSNAGAASTATYQLTQIPSCTSISTHNSSQSSADAFSIDSPTSKISSDSKKSKGKRRRTANMSPTLDGSYERIFLWDLDETCILFHSLLTGAYASKFDKDVNASVSVGLRMEELIFHLSDTHFFFNELEDCDQAHIDDIAADDSQDLSTFSLTSEGLPIPTTNAATFCLVPGVRGSIDFMRKIAFRYRRIRDLYNLYKDNVGGLLGCGKQEQWLQIRNDIETFTDSWHSLVLKCLSQITSKTNYANILVTTSPLIPTYAKLLLYGISSMFPIENIYCAAKIGKEACFERILHRFGKKCTYVVVGDGREEEVAAKQMQFPFWRVTNHSDLLALHHALELGHL
ncbi:Eyes absent -like protein 1 [Trichinella patagoniensis]|uniref:Eyes absent homolog n=1 Tax=Trichinella patagoniensis TaxID=990121 RepID=A0A0V1ABY9_9BILA|nr:Eyes absent -like protein 1 [Trichinella patagoniensis]